MTYQIVTLSGDFKSVRDALNQFESKVNREIAKGYEPIGGIIIRKTEYHTEFDEYDCEMLQTMIKK